jgi:hypothetical protein
MHLGRLVRYKIVEFNCIRMHLYLYSVRIRFDESNVFLNLAWICFFLGTVTINSLF